MHICMWKVKEQSWSHFSGAANHYLYLSTYFISYISIYIFYVLYIYIYIVCVYVCVYDRERERERDPDRKGLCIVNEHHKQSFILSMNENYIECFIFLAVRCDEHICASVPYSTLHDSYM